MPDPRRYTPPPMTDKQRRALHAIAARRVQQTGEDPHDWLRAAAMLKFPRLTTIKDLNRNQAGELLDALNADRPGRKQYAASSRPGRRQPAAPGVIRPATEQQVEHLRLCFAQLGWGDGQIKTFCERHFGTDDLDARQFSEIAANRAARCLISAHKTEKRRAARRAGRDATARPAGRRTG